jgi:hypothetical protein
MAHTAADQEAAMSAWVERQWQARRDGLGRTVIILGLFANLMWIGAGVFAVGMGINSVIGLLR